MPAPDETRALDRQVVRAGVEGRGGREVRRQSLDHQVGEVLRVRQILEAMQADVAQADPVRKIMLHQRTRGRREQDLASVRHGCDPGRPVHVQAEVVVAAQHPLARVEPGPDPKLDAVGPGAARQPPSGRDRGPHRFRRSLEDHEERIALGAHLVAATRGDRRSEDLGVAILHGPVAVAEPLQEPGRPLDIGEQEGDGAGRTLVSGHPADDGAPPESAARRRSHRFADRAHLT